MKKFASPPFSLVILTSWTLAAPLIAQSPAITHAERSGTNVVIRVDVPAGMRRVTLESRERLGEGNWSPRLVARVNGNATEVSFTIDASSAAELLRVRADASETLPSTFYTGQTSFLNQASSAVGVNGTAPNSSSPGSANTTSLDSTRTVVESDIWKIRGNTLYFFNQLRGLQIIDLTQPDAARLTGTLSLPAAGEQMYLLGDRHVVLLARQGCSYDSSVIIVLDDGGKPSVISRLPVSGSIQESRMVGSALYLASQAYRPKAGTTNTVWEWGSEVTSFDLSDPKTPVKRNTFWYSGWGNVVFATDTYLFVATQDLNNWWQSTVNILDVTAPDGTMSEYGSIHTAGRVPDKFKLNYTGAVLTAISEDSHWSNGAQISTKIETFLVPDPRSMVPFGILKLGELEIGQRERLRATRFDGNLVYVVTFFQIDPLWVVDLSDPLQPRVAGELQVPGWSTYIEPLGDRLVAVGVETNRVTVSLFDVHNPASPALLDKVHLGESYSWSEANYNEKAFSVFPDAGLILIPYSGYTSNGYSSQVQLIDLYSDSLQLRGMIEHPLEPRRSTLFGDRILSLSGWDLLTVAASDRDHPIVQNDLKLAWPVDRVLMQGDFLLEISSSPGWGAGNAAGIRVARMSDSDRIIADAVLPDLPVTGATVRGNRLCIAQAQQTFWYPYVVTLADGEELAADRSGRFILSIFDLSELPGLALLGRLDTNTTLGWSGDLQSLWPANDLLVWAGGGSSFLPYMLLGGPMQAVGTALWRPWFFGSGGQFIAFDVNNPAAPQLASEVSITPSNSWWPSFSQAFTEDGKIFVSHTASEFVLLPDSSPVALDTVGIAGTITPPIPIGTWAQRSLLDVLDYADSRRPTIRKPVCIPGALNGVAYGGELLFTVGTHWTTNLTDAWIEYLDASAYDGVSAHLIDSIPLSSSWPHPVLVKGTNVLMGQPNTAATATLGYQSGTIDTWAVSGTGKFTKLGSQSLKTAANAFSAFGDALVVQELDNSIDLFNAADASRLRLINSGTMPGCIWPDLQHGDASVADGFWNPLGVYGIWHLPGDAR